MSDKILEIGSLKKFIIDEVRAALLPIFNPASALERARSGDPYNISRFQVVENKPGKADEASPSPSK